MSTCNNKCIPERTAFFSTSPVSNLTRLGRPERSTTQAGLQRLVDRLSHTFQVFGLWTGASTATLLRWWTPPTLYHPSPPPSTLWLKLVCSQAFYFLKRSSSRTKIKPAGDDRNSLTRSLYHPKMKTTVNRLG